MLSDQGPDYRLGFGIAPNAVNISKDYRGQRPDQAAFDPNSGAIAKALYKHPVARFLTETAASAIAIGVASKLVKGGGVKLSSLFKEINPEVNTWRTSIAHGFRSTQDTLDTWEGIGRIRDEDGLTKSTFKRAGFFISQADKERSAAAVARGDYGDDPVSWALRDEIQQRLVHRARALPYELPAIYAAGKLDDKLTGAHPDEKVKWYNPVDVIGDFAEFSVRNVASQLMPWEVGTGVASQGWRKLLTYGDVVSDTQPFSNRIHLVSVGMQQSLSALGQSTSKILYETTKRSSQVAGSFGSAITSSLQERQPSGLLYSAKIKRGFQEWKDNGLAAASRQLFPSAHSFIPAFKKTYSQIEEDNRNYEALINKRPFYSYKGKDDNRANPFKTDSGHSYSSDFENFARAINQYKPITGANGNLTGGFAELKLRDEYLKNLTEAITSRNKLPNTGYDKSRFDASVNKFINTVQISGYPGTDANARRSMIRRVRFGSGKIVDETELGGKSWEENFTKRLSAVMPMEHASRISSSLQGAMMEADRPFQNRKWRNDFNNRIQNEWDDLYQRAIIPGIKARTREVRMPSEMVYAGMPPARREAMIRKLAASYGIDTQNVTTNTITQQLVRHGVNVNDFYTLKGHLQENKLIARPWQRGGFNIFGLRPLTVGEGLDRNFFPGRIQNQVGMLNQDLSDKLMGDFSNIEAGRGVYLTSSGQVLDMRKFLGSARKISDIAAQHLQVPVLGFSPYDLVAYNARRMMRDKPLIQIESGKSRHLSNFGEADNLVYIGGRRQGIGSLYRYSPSYGAKKVPGQFRSGLTGGESLIARQTRIALGETGFYREPHDNNTRMGRFKNWLNLNPNQPDSIVEVASKLQRSQLAGRIRNALNKENSDSFVGDRRNPALFARRIRELGKNGYNLEPEDLAGFEKFEQDLRYNYSLTPSVIKRLQKFVLSDPKLSHLHDLFNITDPVTGEQIPLSDIRNPSVMYRSVEAMLNHDELDMDYRVESGNIDDKSILGQTRSARNFIKRAYLDQESISGAMENPSPRNIKSTGIHRRIDEFRSDVYQYIISRQVLTNKTNTDIIDDLLAAVDQMKSQHIIGGNDYIEARAAILGAQVRTSSIRHHYNAHTEAQRVQLILQDLNAKRSTNRLNSVIADLGQYHGKMFGHYDVFNLKRRVLSGIGAGAERDRYQKINIYRGGQQNVYIPTTLSSFARNPLGAAKSVLGINTWSSPEDFSMGSVASGHLVERLNRYFSLGDLGLDPSKFRSPLSMYAVGMVGKRVLPAVVALNLAGTLDRTAGGIVYGKDQNGKRRYKPLVGGALATSIAHVDIALTPGKDRREEKRQQYFGDEDVAVRRGRYWAMGSTPWKGGRVQYFRPNWYRRYMSGYQYTGQDWKSPIQKQLFGEDYSPLRVIDPYKYEVMHAKDRPYPTTGQYFSGPWGPLTSALNATVGHVLKPNVNMHQAEMRNAMSQYQAAGYGGMVFNPDYYHGGQEPLVVTRAPTGAAQIAGTATAGQILGMQESALLVPQGGGNWNSPYYQANKSMGVPYGTAPYSSVLSGGQNGRMPSGGPVTSAAAGNQVSNQMLANVNNTYSAMAGTPANKRRGYQGPTPLSYSSNSQANALGPNPYNVVVTTPDRSFDPRVVYAADPTRYNKFSTQAGQFGFESQEMAGIYGFAAGNIRAGLGLGRSDFAPLRPVYQSADRAYGSERSFWDLNLGGLGDFPVYGSSEFGNIEMSEIVRRFIPHRRREINEINPIPNTMGQQYPWLPGSDYIYDFKRGDPYAIRDQIPGEMLLPGPAYERFHKLHSDATGKYGILDQQRILGLNAPYSAEYKAINQVVSRVPMNPGDKAYAQQTRKMVAEEKKKTQFYPYKYAHSNFVTKKVTVTGYVPGEADMLLTDQGMIKFAGVQAKANKEAMAWLQNSIQPQQHIKITFDANFPPRQNQPIDAIVEADGRNINQELLGQPDLSYPSRKQSPLNTYLQEGPTKFETHALIEEVEHANTYINNKLYPHRTAVEDWERNNVYGSSFPTWNTPYSSFIRPLAYRAMNRNPIEAAVALGVAGRFFGRTQEAKTVGSIAGAALGFGLALFSNTKTYNTGQRFLPQGYKDAGAIDEYADILNYVKYSRLYSMARLQAMQDEHTDPEQIARQTERSQYKQNQLTNIGPETAAALQYRQQIQSTLYGSNVYGDVMALSAAIPKQQRQYFLEFLSAPANERQRILSTMPRLERRIFEARWGMRVEQRPNLEQYFSQHELPPANWVGWDPNLNMDSVKVKMAQHQGLNLSQMGYYPQQISEANALNLPYPDFTSGQSPAQSAAALRAFMSANDMAGQVQIIPSNQPGSMVELHVGVNS